MTGGFKQRINGLRMNSANTSAVVVPLRKSCLMKNADIRGRTLNPHNAVQ